MFKIHFITQGNVNFKQGKLHLTDGTKLIEYMKQKNQENVGRPEAGKPTWYNRIKETLAVASQLVIASPVRLPPKVVVVARYVALALGVLEAVEGAAQKGETNDAEPLQ